MDFSALTIKAATPDQVLPFVVTALRYDTASTSKTPEQVIASCDAFVIEHDGKSVGGLLLQRRGKEIYVVTAAGKAKIDLSFALDELILNNKADDIESVSFTTKRLGLVKKAKKAGYEIDGYILRKRIKTNVR